MEYTSKTIVLLCIARIYLSSWNMTAKTWFWHRWEDVFQFGSYHLPIFSKIKMQINMAAKLCPLKMMHTWWQYTVEGYCWAQYTNYFGTLAIMLKKTVVSIKVFLKFLTTISLLAVNSSTQWIDSSHVWTNRGTEAWCFHAWYEWPVAQTPRFCST